MQQFYLPPVWVWGKRSICCRLFHTSCSRCRPWRFRPFCWCSNPWEKQALSPTGITEQNKRYEKKTKRKYVLYLGQNIFTVTLEEELLVIKSGVMTFSVHCAGGVARPLRALPKSRFAFAVNQRLLPYFEWYSTKQWRTKGWDLPGVALLHDFFSRAIKNIVVLAGTLVLLHAASFAVLQQAFRTHAAALALLTRLRGQTTILLVSRQVWFFF